MKTPRMFVLGNPTDRCSFVWLGEPPEKSDKFYLTFSRFKEYEIETIQDNKDGTFDIKLKNVNFTYRYIKPVKEEQL